MDGSSSVEAHIRAGQARGHSTAERVRRLELAHGSKGVRGFAGLVDDDIPQVQALRRRASDTSR